MTPDIYIAIPLTILLLYDIIDGTFLEDARTLISMQKLIETSATCLLPIAFKWDKTEGTSRKNAIVIDDTSRRAQKGKQVEDLHPLQEFAKKTYRKKLRQSLERLENRTGRNNSVIIKKQRMDDAETNPSEKDKNLSSEDAFQLLKLVANYYVTRAVTVATNLRRKRNRDYSKNVTNDEENTDIAKLIRNFKDAELNMNIWASEYVTNNIDEKSSELLRLHKFAETAVENDRHVQNNYLYYEETRKVCLTAILNYLNSDVPEDGYKYKNAFQPIQQFLKFKRTIFTFRCGYLPLSPNFSSTDEALKFNIYKIRTPPYGYILFEIGFPVDYIILTKNMTEVVVTKVPLITLIGDKKKLVIDVL